MERFELPEDIQIDDYFQGEFGIGARVRVVEPPELAERVRAELEGALRGYSGAVPKKKTAG